MATSLLLALGLADLVQELVNRLGDTLGPRGLRHCHIRMTDIPAFRGDLVLNDPVFDLRAANPRQPSQAEKTTSISSGIFVALKLRRVREQLPKWLSFSLGGPVLFGSGRCLCLRCHGVFPFREDVR